MGLYGQDLNGNAGFNAVFIDDEKVLSAETNTSISFQSSDSIDFFYDPETEGISAKFNQELHDNHTELPRTNYEEQFRYISSAADLFSIQGRFIGDIFILYKLHENGLLNIADATVYVYLGSYTGLTADTNAVVNRFIWKEISTEPIAGTPDLVTETNFPVFEA